jgi:hypothetical protein
MLKYRLQGPEEAARQSSLHPGPDVAGARASFSWSHCLDLFCLVAMLPLVEGAMWRVCADL